MKSKTILLAGATGYLGTYIARELSKSDYAVKLLVRDKKRLKFTDERFEIIEAGLTPQYGLEGVFDEVDTVISTVGITKQKDGLTYMDVDYSTNMNLLEKAKRNGVRKFIYVSAFKGEDLTHLKIGKAKEKFVQTLIRSGMEYCIIRPNGFFSDTLEFMKMAKNDSVYLFKKGKCKMNPIHGEDVAKVCVNAIQTNEKNIEVGGPEIFTHNEMATLAFKTLNKTPKIKYVPDCFRKMVLFLTRLLTNSKTYGPVEFFMTVLAMDMVAPKYGDQTLASFFKSEVDHIH